MAKNKIGRREFIGKATLGLAATGLSLPLFKGYSSGKEQENVIYRTLGRTKLRIPIVSFGVMNTDSPDLLHKALDLGLNHLDTAHLYLRGNSEKVIGEVIEERGNRDKVYIATKMRFARDREKLVFSTERTAREPVATEENLEEQLNISLRRLRTDYIDILYIHSCYSPEMATFEPLMKAMVKVKEAGKARFIGISTHSNESDVIRAAADTGIYDVILTSYNFMQKHKEDVKKAIHYAAEKDIGIIAMKTQGGVRLNQKKTIEVDHAAALKWALNDKNVCTAIPGITTFSQLNLDFGVMKNLVLSETEKRDLQLASMLKGPLYCQNCRSCITSCSNKVEIPSLMRAYMYAEGYGNLIQAKSTVSELPGGKSLQVCQDCKSCTAACPNGISIGARINNLINQGIHLG